MAHTTATYRLQRMVMFDLICAVERNACYRCDKPMSWDTWSMDHVRNWENVDVALFWDVSNIAFSHVLCNVRASRGGGNGSRRKADDTHWCSKHKGYLPAAEFYGTSQSPTGLSYWCRDCKRTANRLRIPTKIGA